MPICTFCGSTKGVSVDERDDNGRPLSYICAVCDQARIDAMRAEYESVNHICNCGPHQPACDHPLCAGYLS